MSSDLASFRASVKGAVCQPGDDGYDLSKWAPNGTKPSKIIVTPEEIEDIVKAIKYARKEGLDLAIRGGGHSTSTASATEGLLIDMRKMTKIRVDAANEIAYIQGGARMGDIEAETIKYGLGAVVGVCTQVSIAGYVLGGGYGYSTGSYGMGLDNLISATVVTASGEVVEASESENPDLFWALRGGGSNFGVVAQLCVKLHPQREDAYAVHFGYLPEQLPQVVKAVAEWRNHQQEYMMATLLFALGPDSKPYVIINGLSNSTKEKGEAAFRSLFDLGPANVRQGQMPWTDLGNLVEDFNAIPGNKTMVGAHIDKFDFEQVQKTWDAWSETIKKAPFSMVMYEFYPYSKAAQVPIKKTAFAQRHELLTVLCGVIWTDDSFSPHARDHVLKLKSIVSGSSSKEAQESLGYSNYADPFMILNETDEYARRIFGSNYPRLQTIKKKYDPDMVFNKWFLIRPEA